MKCLRTTARPPDVGWALTELLLGKRSVLCFTAQAYEFWDLA